MEFIVIILTSFLAAGLTLFSGFGLGTILMPAFAIFFPVDIAISLTAIVHLFNNLFKLILLGKHATWTIIIKFGIPAILAAYIGATFLTKLSLIESVFHYHLWGHIFYITHLKIIVAILMIIFACWEIIPFFNKLSFNINLLPAGGIISGFFGGLSGHQGALRSAFLLRCGLAKENFIATGVVIACMIDIPRIYVYADNLIGDISINNIPLILVAILSAFSGSFIGNKLIKKVTIHTIQVIVAVMLFFISVLLGIGIL